MPGVTGVTVVTMLVCFFILHARLRAHRAPGIPCALFNSRVKHLMSELAHLRRDREGVSHCRVVLANARTLAVGRKSLNSVSQTTDTEYGFLLSQERHQCPLANSASACCPGC